MPDGTAVRAEIAAERTELADILAGLSEADWDRPTLCAGWRVREVVAHITMAFRYPAGKVPLDRVKIVLGGLKPRNVNFFGVDLEGIELRADDMDWSYGSGQPVTGAAQDLLLVLCRRKLPAGRIHGKDSERFTATEQPT